jgi:hypothetical protein
MTVQEWYNKKRKEYLRLHNEEWKFLNWNNSLIQETCMRMSFERQYIGLVTPDEDVIIANCIVIKDTIEKYGGHNV